MSLFQKSVEKKYLSELDKALIDKKYAEFQEYFGNAERQENIRNAKEEQFQEGFLRELFVKIFDYTLNPELNFNLTTELKNISNSKKADGAILRDENAIAVIELKSTDTTDLTTVEAQAFGYKNHHPKCVYVITSNFEKLRFYIQNAVYHLEFDLFKLSKDDFSLMWLCLAKDNLLKDIPLKIKESSVVQEENITKLLYSDYSKFREAIFRNLVENNPEIDKLLLFKKTQKLIDRFLFIFFAEDKQLLPPNSINEIVQQWDELKDKYDEYFPLYDRFKKYFGYLNTGYVGKKYSIYAYNGGLFTPDEILDNISIDDNILREHTLKLSNYDFDTDVDVNILGHIFEHSLGEIENVEAEIKGEKVEQEKTRRKKDGIFYTPKYITKYIVENTIGKLCDEKRKELEIIDEDYAKGRKNRKKETIKVLDEKLKMYRGWLLSLTILDPACGSGAFLNQALEFLIAEHKKIDELNAQLFGAGLVFSDITTDILEKNIFGVDLNEESVEIAKLSLWLRTASKGRKLNTLSNNIKCGNSLIDDPEVAGEKAFNWQNEFPDIFAKGGFDVIIGNPPYGALFSESQKIYYIKKYELSPAIIDTYLMFLLKTECLLKKNSLLSYIIPTTWLYMNQYKDFRNKVICSFQIPEITLFRNPIFEDATVETCITIIKNTVPTDTSIYKYIENNLTVEILRISIKQLELLEDENNSLLLKKELDSNLFKKISNNSINLDFCTEIVCGLTPYRKGKGKPPQNEETVNNRVFDSEIKKDDTYRQYLMGRDFTRYRWQLEKERWISYGVWLAEPRYAAPFNEPVKIIIRQTADSIIAHIDTHSFLSLKNVHNLKITNNSLDYKFLLALLNSKLINWWYQKLIPEKGRVFAEVKVVNLKKLPIKIPENQTFFIQKANDLLELNYEVSSLIEKFINRLKSNFNLFSISSKLESFYELEFKDLISELIKYKIKLSLNQQDEWEVYFTKYKSEIQSIKSAIEKTDKEIDKIVYELYSLTEEEIKIIEATK